MLFCPTSFRGAALQGCHAPVLGGILPEFPSPFHHGPARDIELRAYLRASPPSAVNTKLPLWIRLRRVRERLSIITRDITLESASRNADDPCILRDLDPHVLQ
jgi:hypothetical protein